MEKQFVVIDGDKENGSRLCQRPISASQLFHNLNPEHQEVNRMLNVFGASFRLARAHVCPTNVATTHCEGQLHCLVNASGDWPARQR